MYDVHINKIDVMLDIETLGTTAGSVVCSIGATTFCHEKAAVLFHEKISVEDSLRVGLTKDEDTVSWWSRQSPKQYADITSGTRPLLDVLVDFRDYLKECVDFHRKSDVLVWGNGADFDNVIVAALYRQIDYPVPWKFYNNRCFRTLKNLFPATQIPAFKGTKHDALSDAQHQAEWAERIYLQNIFTGQR